jgi:hypothetical protein
MDCDEPEYFSKMLGATALEFNHGQEYYQEVSDLPYMLQNTLSDHMQMLQRYRS